MTTQVHIQSAFGLRLRLQILRFDNLQGSVRQSCLCCISASLFMAVRSNCRQGGDLFVQSPPGVRFFRAQATKCRHRILLSMCMYLNVRSHCPETCLPGDRRNMFMRSNDRECGKKVGLRGQPAASITFGRD